MRIAQSALFELTNLSHGLTWMPHKNLLTELLLKKKKGGATYSVGVRTHTSSTKIIKYPTERQENTREKPRTLETRFLALNFATFPLKP